MLITPEIGILTNFIVPTPSTVDAIIEPDFVLPKPESLRREGPLLGWVRKYGEDLYPVNLSIDDLTTHVAIFGMTGSGKSTTAALILSHLIDLGVKCLVIDWHNEYRNLVIQKGGYVFTPGRDIAPLTLNPLDPSLSEDLSEHISLVTDIFADIFSFTPPQSYMFIECLRSVYRKCGYFGNKLAAPPTISLVVETIERAPIRSAYDNETKLALLRRLKPLTEGQAGRALDGQSTISIEDIINNVVSIEVGHFKEQEIRKIFTSIFLKLLYDYRTKKRAPSLKHVTIVEEANNIIPARRPESPPSIGERMVSELRKFGEGLIIISQFPTQLSPEILKNAATRIFHRIKDENDRRVVEGALNLTERQSNYIHYLKPGEAIVSIPAVPHPFLMYVRPEIDMLEHLPDEELKEIMRERLYSSLIELEVEAPIAPMRRMRIEVELYQLIRKNKVVSQEQIKEKMKDFDYYMEVVPALEKMVEDEIIEKEIDQRTGQVKYKLAFPTRI